MTSPCNTLIELRDMAERLHRAGLPPIPCAGKRPLVAGYPAWATTPPSLPEVLRQVRRCVPCNLGIVVPAGIALVEADTGAADEELRTLAAAAFDATPARLPRPGRGHGLLLGLPAGVHVASRAHLGTSGAIDVKGPGAIFVVPPSVHQTGHVYRWAAGRAPWEVPVLPVSSALLAVITAGATSSGTTTTTTAASMNATVTRVSRPPATRMPRSVTRLLATNREFRALWDGTGKKEGDTSRSGYDATVAAQLLGAGVQPRDVEDALALRPDGHAPGDPAYAARTVAAMRRLR
jgi:hypothetical protein